MSASSQKKIANRKAAAGRGANRAKVGSPAASNVNALPESAFPTAEEMEELGKFADRVAAGKEPVTRIKL